MGVSLQEGESVTGKHHSECTGKNGTRQFHMMRQSFSEARKQVSERWMPKGTLSGCCIEAHNHKPEGLRLLARPSSARNSTHACCNRDCVPRRVSSEFSYVMWTLLMQNDCTGPFRSAIARLRMENSSAQETLLKHRRAAPQAAKLPLEARKEASTLAQGPATERSQRRGGL
jgi:hypothetical protein